MPPTAAAAAWGTPDIACKGGNGSCRALAVSFPSASWSIGGPRSLPGLLPEMCTEKCTVGFDDTVAYFLGGGGAAGGLRGGFIIYKYYKR